MYRRVFQRTLPFALVARPVSASASNTRRSSRTMSRLDALPDVLLGLRPRTAARCSRWIHSPALSDEIVDRYELRQRASWLREAQLGGSRTASDNTFQLTGRTATPGRHPGTEPSSGPSFSLPSCRFERSVALQTTWSDCAAARELSETSAHLAHNRVPEDLGATKELKAWSWSLAN